MDGKCWWDTTNDDSFVNEILKFSVDARVWYLKTDVKLRLKRFIFKNVDFDEIIGIWKRLHIIKNNFGEETGSLIIQQAVEEIIKLFNDTEWAESVQLKIAQAREKLTDDFVLML